MTYEVAVGVGVGVGVTVGVGIGVDSDLGTEVARGVSSSPVHDATNNAKAAANSSPPSAPLLNCPLAKSGILVPPSMRHMELSCHWFTQIYTTDSGKAAWSRK